MLLVHVDGMSLRMVITWPGLLLYLVFSDKLSLGDDIAAAGKYKSKCKASELENDFQVDVEGISDEQILECV
jgi:hypothetical protein